MASQRFCLRWNNHQSNLLSVFDQLLHAETFTDVTLAIDGQYLKAHKMVLSACSPYFQQLFVNHPEKHPIVILKDVPFADMKSLLDFMYRGEVSVDQERLSAFLRVAESLRIKGLTEVNDDKPSNRDQSETPPTSTPNRVHPYVLQQQQQQRKVLQQQTSNNPLLGTALSMPKRKRGRPRKLSGSDDVDECEDDYRENLLQESPELLEVKMGAENDTNSDGNESRKDNEDNDEMDENGRLEPQNKRQATERTTKPKTNSKKDDDTGNEMVTVKTEPMDANDDYDKNDDKHTDNTPQPPQIRVSDFATQSGAASLVNVINQLQQKQQNHDSMASNHEEMKKDKITMWVKKDNTNINNSPILLSDIRSTSIEISPNSSLTSPSSGSGQKSLRRRIRRKHNSPDDQAEALTEMSVRGLNLFRYASIQDGVYKCTECAKESVQKTFKNKYSFQRHAFLYHEGTQRKVFPCPVCRKEFSRPDKMKNHMKMTHECYMPKECKFPLPLLIAGSSQSPVNNNILNLATTQ